MATPAKSKAVVSTTPSTIPEQKSNRIATIDWMRGLVTVLMILDHASMAFDGTHISHDSAMFPDAATMPLAVFIVISAFSMVLVLIADLDRPGDGLFRINQENMIDVRNSM